MKKLFRPVGLVEMKLILDLDLREFPPRLPEQPIFYPVLNQAYADQIAFEWNTKDKPELRKPIKPSCVCCTNRESQPVMVD